MSKEFIVSNYHKDIFNFIKYGHGNAVINAVAGSGKTSTLIEILKLIDKNNKVIFLAFNKSIADELKTKINLSNVKVQTLHSLGYGVIKYFLRGKDIKLDNYKYNNYVYNNINLLTSIDISNMNHREYGIYTHNIISLCEFARNYLAQTEKDLKLISEKHNIICLNDEYSVVLKLLEWGKNNLNTIDYTDMIYLPIALKMPVFKYDYVMVDEAQDLCAAQRELCLKCFKMGTRAIFVGDKNQSIYGFRGADEFSFDKLKNTRNTQSFPLSITYRCSKNIVKFVKKLVPEIESSPSAEDGSVKNNMLISDVNNGDMILCRNTSPLVMLYIDLLSKGKKCIIKGKDIGQNMISMIKNSGCEILNVKLDKKGVFSELYKHMFDIKNNLIKNYGYYDDDAYLCEQVQLEFDAINALNILSNGLTTSQELINKINKVFGDTIDDSIVLSTIHKAKGLESNNIFILGDRLMPSKFAKTDYEINQENNLKYVAYTRAKNNLYFFNENEEDKYVQGNDIIDSQKILNKMRNIENLINVMYNKKRQRKTNITSKKNNKNDK